MGNHLFYYKRQTRDTKILSSLDCDSSNHNLPRFFLLPSCYKFVSKLSRKKEYVILQGIMGNHLLCLLLRIKR